MKKIKRLTAAPAVDAANGDISAAEDVGAQLAMFLSNLAGNKDAQKAMMAAGVGWIGNAAASLIVERLLASAPAGKGKTPKSGIDLFAKFLVPGKTTLRQQYSRWLSTMVEANTTGDPTNEDYRRVAELCQQEIDINDRILRDFKAGHCPSYDGYSPATPPKSFGIITKDKLQKAYLSLGAERDRRDGIHRAK